MLAIEYLLLHIEVRVYFEISQKMHNGLFVRYMIKVLKKVIDLYEET
jgi:hypothetical protein